jgi:hypothetical protein
MIDSIVGKILYGMVTLGLAQRASVHHTKLEILVISPDWSKL